MMEILKKAGLATGISTVLVLAITFLPILYQFETTADLQAEIAALKLEVAALKVK